MLDGDIRRQAADLPATQIGHSDAATGFDEQGHHRGCVHLAKRRRQRTRQ
jgi:hypothetical protein